MAVNFIKKYAFLNEDEDPEENHEKSNLVDTQITQIE